MKERKKTWKDKVELVQNSYLRAKNDAFFANAFYGNLFFLKPKIKDYFDKKGTDFEHQEKALMNGLDFFFGYLDESDQHSRDQVNRLSITHSQKNMNIHPHDYHYWSEALVLTLKASDPSWFEDMEHYTREVISYPLSYFVSKYFL